LKIKVNDSDKVSEKYSVLPPIDIPGCVTKEKGDLKSVKDDVLDYEYIIGSYNPKKLCVPLLTNPLLSNREKPNNSNMEKSDNSDNSDLLGDQSDSITGYDDDGLFFGDLEW